MPVVTKDEAVKRLAKAVEEARPDDLVEIYTELFPARPAPDVTGEKVVRLAKEIANHIHQGLEPEEIIDLWNVVFPAHRHVYYDEEDKAVRYNEAEVRYAEE
jgi:hypothetical protein